MSGSRCGLRGRFFPGGRRHAVRSRQSFPAIGVAGRPVGWQASGYATPPWAMGARARFAPYRSPVEVALRQFAVLGAEVSVKGRAEQSTPAAVKTVFEAPCAAGVDEDRASENMTTHAVRRHRTPAGSRPVWQLSFQPLR